MGLCQSLKQEAAGLQHGPRKSCSQRMLPPSTGEKASVGLSAAGRGPDKRVRSDDPNSPLLDQAAMVVNTLQLVQADPITQRFLASDHYSEPLG